VSDAASGDVIAGMLEMDAERRTDTYMVLGSHEAKPVMPLHELMDMYDGPILCRRLCPGYENGLGPRSSWTYYHRY